MRIVYTLLILATVGTMGWQVMTAHQGAGAGWRQAAALRNAAADGMASAQQAVADGVWKDVSFEGTREGVAYVVNIIVEEGEARIVAVARGIDAKGRPALVQMYDVLSREDRSLQEDTVDA